MNVQKKIEKRIESWKRHETKQVAIEQSKTFEGRARLRNTIAAEMFDDRQAPEIDDLDFQMF